MPRPMKITVIIETEHDVVITEFPIVREIHWETTFEEPESLVGMGNPRYGLKIQPPKVESMSLTFKPEKDSNGILYTQKDSTQGDVV